MPEFYDLGLRTTSRELCGLAESLEWTATSCDLKTVFIEADDWGDLKRKIGENREDAAVLVFRGGDEELNRKAAGDTRIDILLHPERGRKDSGIDHVIAEEAAENRVAIGFDLRQLFGSDKAQTHVLRHWSRNLKLCEKYGTPYVITSGASNRHQLRAPRELAAVINSLGFDGKAAVSENPAEIVERTQRAREEGFVRPGVETGEGEDDFE